jgi:hypothetical protein
LSKVRDFPKSAGYLDFPKSAGVLPRAFQTLRFSDPAPLSRKVKVREFKSKHFSK